MVDPLLVEFAAVSGLVATTSATIASIINDIGKKRYDDAQTPMDLWYKAPLATRIAGTSCLTAFATSALTVFLPDTASTGFGRDFAESATQAIQNTGEVARNLVKNVLQTGFMLGGIGTFGYGALKYVEFTFKDHNLLDPSSTKPDSKMYPAIAASLFCFAFAAGLESSDTGNNNVNIGNVLGETTYNQPQANENPFAITW